MPATRRTPPTAFGTTWPRKSDTDVTSPSTRWISSPGVWRRWNSWSSPSTWRVMRRRSSFVVPQAVTVAYRVTTTAMTWVATAMARNARARRTNSAVLAPSVAWSTMARTTSGPASDSAELTARSAPRTAQRRASGRRRASRARPRDGDSTGTRPVSRRVRRSRTGGFRRSGAPRPLATGSVLSSTLGPMEQDTSTATLVPTDDADDALVEEELLVEEISIDGMCGVY